MPFSLQQVQRAADYWTAELATYNSIINPDLIGDLDDNVRNYINKRNRSKNDEVHSIFDVETREIERIIIREPVKFDPVMLEMFVNNVKEIYAEGDWSKESYWAADSLIRFKKLMVSCVVEDILQEKYLETLPSDEPRHYRIEYVFGNRTGFDNKAKRALEVYNYSLYYALSGSDCDDYAKSHMDLPQISMNLYENGGILAFFHDFLSPTNPMNKFAEVPLQPKGHMNIMTAHPKEIWAEPTSFGFDQESLNEIANLSPKFSQLIHNLLQNANQGR